MMIFRPVELGDKGLIEGYLRGRNVRQLNYSFDVLFLWRDACDFEIAEKDGFLLIKTYHHSQHNFLFPLGEGDLKQIILEMRDYALAKGCCFQMFQILPEQKNRIESLLPGEFSFEPARDEYEYIYESHQLATLQGKALQPKRNHINAFEKENKWSFEEITELNMLEVLLFSHRWDEEMNIPIASALNMENQALITALEAFFCLDLDGGILRVDGRVVAFSIGCPLSDDTYLVLFEKADGNIKGAYPMINREFVRRFCTNYRYVNRAEDNGDVGLRKAKLSYHPDILQDIYRMSVKKRTS